ncbi:hypothetical protein [Chryseobacterium sp. Leaf180]|uniref:hypothetical protein n=1 Tax=Chryseobacterium sp. Leaf180 TaxID=1736289 RepID=UPI000A997258|nr:hypothetical protein [Chryseobacterium sp. Leaf180]
MIYLKINTEKNADPQLLKNAISMMKGVESVEIIDEKNPESELKKAFAKTKEQLKKGDYETVVNDIFEIFTKTSAKKQEPSTETHPEKVADADIQLKSNSETEGNQTINTK